jgi:hypothetical protein
MAEAQRNLATRKTESEIAENNAQAQHYADQTGIARRQQGLAELNAQRERMHPSIQLVRDFGKLTPEQRADYIRLNTQKNDRTESDREKVLKFVVEAVSRGERMETAKENARKIYGTNGSGNSTAKSLEKRLPDGRQVININGQTFVTESPGPTPVPTAPTAAPNLKASQKKRGEEYKRKFFSGPAQDRNE